MWVSCWFLRVVCEFDVVDSWIGFFCFKQKTAYEVRIRNWSSDGCSSDLHVDALPLFLDAPSQSPIFRVRGTDLPPLESRDPFRHEHIEFMEVDVGQDWRDDTALRSAAVGPGVNPVFHNTRLKHAADQADEFLVIDPFPQQPQEDVVVDVLEEPRDIHIYEPFHPRPYGFDVFKRRMTRPARPESMGGVREHRFIDPFEQLPRHFLNEAVVARGNAQRTPFALAFRDKHPTH